MATIEEQVRGVLDDEIGTDRTEVVIMFGGRLSHRQVSGALGRLKSKGLADCGRWRETSVWWRRGGGADG